MKYFKCDLNIVQNIPDWRTAKAPEVRSKVRESFLQEHVRCSETDTTKRRMARSLQGFISFHNKICTSWCCHLRRIWIHLRLVGILGFLKLLVTCQFFFTIISTFSHFTQHPYYVYSLPRFINLFFSYYLANFAKAYPWFLRVSVFMNRINFTDNEQWFKVSIVM